jgi:hypothetical protein
MRVRGLWKSDCEQENGNIARQTTVAGTMAEVWN